MLQEITVTSDQTTNKVNEEIEKTKAELHTKRDRNKREEIISALRKKDEQLQHRKTKKFNYLKFKPKNQSSSEENKEIIDTEKRTNEHFTPSYTSVQI